MAKSGSRRWYIALAALLLVLAGVWSYRAYFSSTNAALRHAEAFLFRRMSVAQLAEQGEYRFFYTTNRTPATMKASWHSASLRSATIS